MLQVDEYLTQRKKPDQRRNHRHTVIQVADAKGEALDAVVRGQSHGVDQKAQQDADKRLLPVLAAQGGHRGKAKDAQCEILAWPKLQRQPRQGLRRKNQNHHADDAAQHR